MRRQPRRVRGPLRWLVVAVVAGSILVGSVVDPGPEVASLGPFGVVAVSTWLHLGAYAVLTLTLLYALCADGRPAVHPAIVPVLVLCYGGAVELLQVPIAYRTIALTDILVNGSGAVLATVAWLAGRRLLAGADPRRF